MIKKPIAIVPGSIMNFQLPARALRPTLYIPGFLPAYGPILP